MRALLVALAMLIAVPAWADSNLPAAHYANRQLADPAKEEAAQRLMVTLRCLVCQGQSIADSNAEMAGDMRALVRQRIEAGESPGAVRKWLIERYGDYVTYDPPFGAATAGLWLAPVVLLLIGGLIAMRSFKRKRR